MNKIPIIGILAIFMLIAGGYALTESIPDINDITTNSIAIDNNEQSIKEFTKNPITVKSSEENIQNNAKDIEKTTTSPETQNNQENNDKLEQLIQEYPTIQDIIHVTTKNIKNIGGTVFIDTINGLQLYSFMDIINKTPEELNDFYKNIGAVFLTEDGLRIGEYNTDREMNELEIKVYELRKLADSSFYPDDEKLNDRYHLCVCGKFIPIGNITNPISSDVLCDTSECGRSEPGYGLIRYRNTYSAEEALYMVEHNYTLYGFESKITSEIVKSYYDHINRNSEVNTIPEESTTIQSEQIDILTNDKNNPTIEAVSVNISINNTC